MAVAGCAHGDGTGNGGVADRWVRHAAGACRRPTPPLSALCQPRISAMTSGYYRTSSPVTALPMIIRWISDVPSKMVKIFASRCQRSTG